jgi:transposase-like protein
MTGTVPCGCGSPWTVRHGSESPTYRRLEGGRAVKADCEVPRFLCKACGRTFCVRPQAVEAAERAVRDRAVDLAFALGRAGAARELGLDHSVVSQMADRWRGDREADTHEAAPDFLVLERANVRKADAILVADADHETLVEVLRGPAALDAWLSRPDRLPPLRVCTPLAPDLAETLRRRLPGAIVMVAPSAVVRAIRNALAAGLRQLRRDPAMRGRNAFPDTARFLRVVDGRADAGEGWPREATALLAAGQAARAIAAAPDRPRGERLWPEFELAASVPGAGLLARLMATWKPAILAGLDHRFVDGLALRMAGLRRLAQSRRPALLFRDFRGYVLLRGYEAVPVMAPDGSGTGAIARGRPLAGLAGLLRGVARSA